MAIADKVIVELEAKLDRYNADVARASSMFEKNMDKIGKSSLKAETQALRSSTAIKGAFAGLSAGLAVRELQRMADTWTDLSSRVGLAVGNMEAAPQVMQRIYEMAQRTYSSLEGTAESFLTNASALKELGYSTNQQLDFTEALNNALVVSGAKAERAASVTDALGKAMADGSLKGNNLNTVIQTGGRVAEVLAEQLGIGVNQLREAGKEGKITGDLIYKALTTRLQELTEQAESMPATVADGFQKIGNALMKYVGVMDQASGVSSTIADGLVFVADNFEHVAAGAAAAAAILLSQYIPAMLRVTAASAAMIATNPFLLLVAAIGGATYALSAFGDEIRPIEGELATLQDYASTVWSDIKYGATEMAQVTKDSFLSIINFITQMMDDTKAEWSDVTSFITNELDGLIGAFKGIVAETKVIFNQLPAAVAEYVIDAMNTLVSNIESALQIVLDGVNKVSKALNYIDGLVGVGPTLREDFKIDLGRVENTYRGAGKVASDAWAEALQEGQKKHFTDYLNQTKNMANNAAKIRTADRKSNDILSPLVDPLSVGGSGSSSAGTSGGGGRSKTKKASAERENELEREIKKIKERTEALKAETAAQAGVNPLVEDYGRAATEAALGFDLLNAAQKAGVAGASEFKDVQQLLHGDLTAMSPAAQELAGNIRNLTSSYGDADVAAQKLAESQGKIKQNAEEMAAFQKDLARGIVDGFVEGKKAADIFADALTKIGNKLLDIAFNGLFDSGGGGIFGALFGGGGGGFNPAGKVGLFASGGYTGSGRKNEPAGVVHKGEVVWSQDDIAKAGGVATVEAMRRGVGGMQSAAPMQSFSAPNSPVGLPSGGGGGSVVAPVYISIDATGADAAGLARVERQLVKLKSEIPAQVVQTVRKAQKSNVSF